MLVAVVVSVEMEVIVSVEEATSVAVTRYES